jgi:peptidoglycan/LPS O-acetylase OafA/YrhL
MSVVIDTIAPPIRIATTPEKSSRLRPQIPALTGLRFFAAFFILWGHSTGWLAQFNDSQINERLGFIGEPGMSLFFVLSGFVIHYNYRDLFFRSGMARAVSEFAAARFARLYPLYVVFLLFAIGANNFIGDSSKGQSILWYHITLTQSWWYTIDPNGRLMINELFPLSWSVSTEMFFYAVYPALIFLIASVIKGKRMLSIAALYVGIVLFILSLSFAFLDPLLQTAQRYLPNCCGQGDDSFYRWFFYYSPYTRVLEFLLGCMTAQAIMQLTSRAASLKEHRWGVRVQNVAVLSVLVISLIQGNIIKVPDGVSTYVHHLENSFLFAPAIAIILFCVARYKSWLSRFLVLPLLVLLGEMSYSIYLAHTWTLRLFEHPARALTPSGALDAVWCVVCGIALTILVSYGTYRVIEMPCRSLLRRWSGTAISAVVGVSGRATVIGRYSLQSGMMKRVPFSAFWMLTLTAIVVTGQSAQSIIHYVRSTLYHRSEVDVLSASYGLSCLVSEGNVTKPIKQLCHFAAKCDIAVSVDQFGDPAPGCDKDFTVVYRCTGQTGTKTGYIPASADGKHIVVACATDQINAATRSIISGLASGGKLQ